MQVVLVGLKVRAPFTIVKNSQSNFIRVFDLYCCERVRSDSQIRVNNKRLKGRFRFLKPSFEDMPDNERGSNEASRQSQAYILDWIPFAAHWQKAVLLLLRWQWTRSFFVFPRFCFSPLFCGLTPRASRTCTLSRVL